MDNNSMISPTNAPTGGGRPLITVWPIEPVVPFDVRWMPVTIDHEGWLHFEGDEPDLRELPEELVLRELRALDPDDDDAVVQFLNDYGGITRTYWPDALAPIDVPLRALPENRPEGASTHILNVAAFLHVARAIASHWVAHGQGDDLREPWRAGHVHLDHQSEAWFYFVRCLNEGLKPYTVRVEYGAMWEPRPDLYEGLCLQMANIVIEGLPSRPCANEVCKNYFVKQRGRALQGQHRTGGVKYCTPLCGKAQAERERRRRKPHPNASQVEEGV